MTAEDLLRQVQDDGLTLRVTERGTLKVSGDAAVIGRWAPALKANKPALLQVLQATPANGLPHADLERRRAYVVGQLQQNPDLRVAYEARDATFRPESGEPVSVVLAIRTPCGIVSAEFSLPREQFDLALFNKMIEETSGRPS